MGRTETFDTRETSLSRRVLLPMLAIGLVAAGAGAAWTYRTAAAELDRQVRDRALLLASAINHAAMVAPDLHSVQHVVEEVAADSAEVAQILVVGRGQLLAAADGTLVGTTIEALPDATARAAIAHATATGTFGFHARDDRVALVAPLEPHVASLAGHADHGHQGHAEGEAGRRHGGHGGNAKTGGQGGHGGHAGRDAPELTAGDALAGAGWLDADAHRGAIYMALNPGSASVGLEHILAGFLPALLGSVAAVLAGAALLLRRRVLEPLRAIRATIRRQAAGDWTARAAVRADDEIGQAAATMNAMLDADRDREAALRLALESADASSRAKSEFLAHMSHELRTPLNAIIGFADMLARQSLGPLGVARYADYATDIGNSGRHLLGIIEQVLTLAKGEEGALTAEKSEPVCLAEVVAEAVRVARLEAEPKGVALAADADAAPRVAGDAGMLRQVALNLVANAVQFTDAGGRVTVAAGRTDDGGAWLEVADTGCGMTEEAVAEAFTPFRRGPAEIAKRSEGTGLGLPLSKRMIDAHGGTLAIESAPGAGTTVRVELPPERVLAEDGAAVEGEEDEADAEAPRAAVAGR